MEKNIICEIEKYEKKSSFHQKIKKQRQNLGENKNKKNNSKNSKKKLICT